MVAKDEGLFEASLHQKERLGQSSRTQLKCERLTRAVLDQGQLCLGLDRRESTGLEFVEILQVTTGTVVVSDLPVNSEDRDESVLRAVTKEKDRETGELRFEFELTLELRPRDSKDFDGVVGG